MSVPMTSTLKLKIHKIVLIITGALLRVTKVCFYEFMQLKCINLGNDISFTGASPISVLIFILEILEWHLKSLFL